MRAASLLAAATASAWVTGCGVGAGEQAGGVHLRVTDDFGAKVITEPAKPKQGGSDTVMRLLQRNADVQTRYGGGFVQAVDGLAGRSVDEQVDWFYYVNGLLAERGAAAWRVEDGDRIWWDRHRWDTAQVNAVVGDFPQPMKDGVDGRWTGALLDCRSTVEVCAAAKRKLEDAGVTVTTGKAVADAKQTRVVVGAWGTIANAAPELAGLTDGPATSGVFARVGDRGDIAPLDAAGETLVQTDLLGDGLVAALWDGSSSPVWVVTGPEDGAVSAAVAALNAPALAGRAAVRVVAGRAQPLPLREGEIGRKVDGS
ncbi:MAG: DUF4430 domain-containing protein [Solirubrobacteraceae bacterium]|nr:DUF4430 domain-containing protein [Solirubrobacteraceae bacterium]